MIFYHLRVPVYLCMKIVMKILTLYHAGYLHSPIAGMMLRDLIIHFSKLKALYLSHSS